MVCVDFNYHRLFLCCIVFYCLLKFLFEKLFGGNNLRQNISSTREEFAFKWQVPKSESSLGSRLRDFLHYLVDLPECPNLRVQPLSVPTINRVYATLGFYFWWALNSDSSFQLLKFPWKIYLPLSP